MIRFIDRKEELKILEDLWKSNKAEFIVIYGRRRIGKTRLIQEFIKNKSGIFHIAENVNKKIQIDNLKEDIARYFKDDLLLNLEIKEWNQLFNYLKKIFPKNKRFYLVIDEFSYILKNSPEIASVLQKFWDTFLRETKIVLILSGSLFGLMKEGILSYSSPLYGRRTKDILLESMKFQDANLFFDFNFEDKLKTYFSIGGVPKYLEVASKYNSFDLFIKNEFLSKYGFFYREPYYILSMEFKEIKTYFSIMNAIAFGKVKPSEIANFVGIETRKLYPYLDILASFRFIKRISPITNPKTGIYLINDTMFDFWFNFVFRNREKIEMDDFKLDKQLLNTYFGKKFENFILEIFPLIKKVERVGKWWHKDKEIDLVAYNEKELILGEVKWKDNINPKPIFKELEKKVDYLPDELKNKKVRYVIFGKSFKKKLENCWDLKDLERLIKNSN